MHLVLARERKHNNRRKCPSPVLEVRASQIEAGGKVALPFPSPLRQPEVKPGGLCVLGKASNLVYYEQGELGLLFQ